MRYILWRPEFNGPVLSIVNGNSASDVFKSLGYDLNQGPLISFCSNYTGSYTYWVCGDDSISKAGTQDDIDAFCNFQQRRKQMIDSLIEWCHDDDPQLMKDSILKMWKPLVTELGEFPLMNLI